MANISPIREIEEVIVGKYLVHISKYKDNERCIYILRAVSRKFAFAVRCNDFANPLILSNSDKGKEMDSFIATCMENAENLWGRKEIWSSKVIK